MLNKSEVDKVNELYKKVDVLTAANTALKDHSHQEHADILVQLTAIEDKLNKLLKK